MRQLLCLLTRQLSYETPGFNKAGLMHLNVTDSVLITRVKKLGEKEQIN